MTSNELDQHDWVGTMPQLLDAIREHESWFGPIKTEAGKQLLLFRLNDESPLVEDSLTSTNR